MEIDVIRLLLVFGFFWTIVGAVIGMILGLRHIKYVEQMDNLAKAGDLAGYHRHLSAFKHSTTTHTHSMLFAVMILVIALSFPLTGFANPQGNVLAVLLISATVIWTVGSLLDVRAAMGLGDLLLLGAIIMTLWGLIEGL